MEVHAGWENVDVKGSVMPTYVARPDGTSAHPALLIAQHAPGVNGFMQAIAQRFAAAGYVSIAPDLFHREPAETADDTRARVQRLRDDEVIVDFQAALAYARGLDEVVPERIGIVGFCIGGRIAHVTASAIGGLAAGVLFYPAYLTVAWGDGPTAFDRSAGIQCPLLAILGADDHNPTREEAERFDEELTRLGKPHEFRFFDGAGHAFLDDSQPDRYRETAAQQAWETTIIWLNKNL